MTIGRRARSAAALSSAGGGSSFAKVKPAIKVVKNARQMRLNNTPRVSNGKTGACHPSPAGSVPPPAATRPACQACNDVHASLNES
jgi:hypothetical protein